jgi:hypothetical protein
VEYELGIALPEEQRNIKIPGASKGPLSSVRKIYAS